MHGQSIGGVEVAVGHLLAVGHLEGAGDLVGHGEGRAEVCGVVAVGVEKPFELVTVGVSELVVRR